MAILTIKAIMSEDIEEQENGILIDIELPKTPVRNDVIFGAMFLAIKNYTQEIYPEGWRELMTDMLLGIADEINEINDITLA